MRYLITAVMLFLTCLCSSCHTCDSAPGVRVESKSRQYVALVEGSNCGPLLSEFDSFVKVERPYYIGGHRVWTSRKTLAGGKLSLDRLRLSWDSDEHLSVKCRCESDMLDFQTNNWRNVTVTYTFSR